MQSTCARAMIIAALSLACAAFGVAAFVLTEWAITYFSYQRAARLITDK